MSWRKLSVLVRQLPQDSRLTTLQIDRMRDGKRPEQSGPAPTPRWGQLNWQLADVVDMLRQVQWTLVAVNSEKGKAPEMPKPTIRPTDRRSVVTSPSDKARLFRELSARVRIQPSVN